MTNEDLRMHEQAQQSIDRNLERIAASQAVITEALAATNKSLAVVANIMSRLPKRNPDA